MLALYALDVGQGDCTFILPPGRPGYAILFDCNDSYTAERFVIDHGIEHLTVVVSHLDRDHILGLKPLIELFIGDDARTIDRIWIARDRGLRRGRHKKIRQLLSTILMGYRDDHFKLFMPAREGGPKVILDDTHRGGCRVELMLPWYGDHLAAGVDRAEDPNAVSAVLRVSFATRSVLLGGDAPLRAWASLDADELSCDVIRTAHHGGDLEPGGSTLDYDGLYRAMGASHGIVSVGSCNPYTHPRDDHMNGLRGAGGCRILCTQLTARCTDDPDRYRRTALTNATEVVYPYRHRSPPGGRHHPAHARRRETPCAGSILVTISEDGALRVTPDQTSWHGPFVESLATPLCIDEPM